MEKQHLVHQMMRLFYIKENGNMAENEDTEILRLYV